MSKKTIKLPSWQIDDPIGKKKNLAMADSIYHFFNDPGGGLTTFK